MHNRKASPVDIYGHGISWYHKLELGKLKGRLSLFSSAPIMSQLDSKALGCTVSIFAGACWLLAMGFSLLTGIGEITVTTIGSFHPFFSYTWGGLAIIVIEHLIGGFIVGWVFAWLYNKCTFCCKKPEAEASA